VGLTVFANVSNIWVPSAPSCYVGRCQPLKSFTKLKSRNTKLAVSSWGAKGKKTSHNGPCVGDWSLVTDSRPGNSKELMLTPLASFNCTGMAFRGGYFLLQLLQLLLLCCVLRYTMAHWSWHILLTFMQLVCSTVMAVNIIMS